MPLAVRNSAGRRRKKPDEKLPERPGESTSAQVMAPTRMKLRVRRRDGAAGSGRPAEEDPRSQETGGGGRGSSRRKSASNTVTAAPAAAAASPPLPASPPPPPPTSTATARTLVAAEDASPDSKCPICLDRFNNLAYLDRCLHRFCFPCIQEWSHNKAECPLCKQPFASILHSVRAEDDFKEYTLRPPPANSSVAATVAMVAAMASAARSDHQMRLMLRRHRTADGGETTTRRRRRERGGRASRRTGVWEWYLDSPRLPLPPLPHHAVSPVVAEDSVEGEDLDQQRMRGVADLAEGVIFEGLTGLGAAGTHNVRASRRLMTRLVTRQRLQREGGAVRRLRERETVGFRRALYRCGIRVRGVAGVSGNQGPQCDITAESFRRNPTHLNRLRPWLRRELTVLYGAHSTLVDIVQRIIMAQLARHGLEDSPTIEEELRPFLLARTDHFLHELVNFARSPLSLENYDLQAAYEPPAAALELDGRSSPSDSSSVIAISEGEEEESWVGGRSDDRRQGRTGGAHNDVAQKRGFLTLSDWDDETPGPSYSTAEPSCSAFSPAPQEAANEEEGGAGEEECLIVGYKKPIAERTPELVQLSSDTEEEEKEKTAEKPPRLLPTTPPPPSCLPTIPPSTSGAFPEEQDDKPKEKDDEQRSRARSWSASSGRSRESLCTLSPSERRQDGKQSGSEAAREKRRRKKRRKARDRSGTLFNPNRSIYPAMMCRRSRSPSPFHSSVESGSPLSLSPPDSSWEYRCSPLPSSVSSPSRSSSPLGFSPQRSSPRTPPTPSLSPTDAHHGEKPGGKRKYKSRHLDSNNKDPTWRPGGGRHGEKGMESEGRREGQHGESSSGSRRKRRRSREDRSPSVEIVYEGTVDAQAVQPPAAKRRRRRRHRTQHSSSPVIITLDSDSSHDDDDDLNRTTISSSSSSPLSSQQTVDFSDLPPLPLVHSAGVGGALDGEIGELPADILDRGSDGSEAEAPPGRRAEDAADGSDRDVDVEHDEDGGSPLRCDDDDDDDDGGVSSSTRGPIGGVDKTASEDGGDSVPTTTSDSRLLATILDDLRGIAAPRCDLSLNFDSTKRRLRVRSDRGGWSTGSERTCNDADSDLPTAAPPPPLHQMAFRVGVEAADVPPLLKQASPARSHHRNTPPPLKHKDAGSPHLSPADRLSPAPPAVDLDSSPASENRTIPPISSLRKHLPSSSAFRGFHSSRHKPPAGSRSPSASEKNSTGADSLSHLNSFRSPTEHSDEDTPPSALRAANPSSPVVDVRSAESREEAAARGDSTAARRSNEAPFSPGSCRAAPVDLRLFAGATAGDKHAFSGVDSNNVSPPLLVPSVESRTRDLCPSDGLTEGAVAAAVDREDESPRDRSPPVDAHRSRLSPPANSLFSRSLTALTDGHINANHVASPSAAAAFHASRPKLSSQSEPVDSDSTLHNHFGPVDPKLGVRDSVASAPRDSNSNSIDARSDARSPGSAWTAHTHAHTVPRRTHK